LSDGELLGVLGEVVGLVREMEGLVLGLVGEVDGRDLCRGFGMSDVGAVLRRVHGFSRREAGVAVELARALRGRPVVEAALGAGLLSVSQAAVIVKAVAGLPVTVSAAEREEVEVLLVEQAAVLEPGELAVCGRVLAEKLTVTADVDDPVEAARVAREGEVSAEAVFARRDFRVRAHHSGLNEVTMLLPVQVSEALTTVLGPLAVPEAAVGGVRDRRGLGQRRVDGLSRLLFEVLDSGVLPRVGGGLRPHFSVTVEYETLVGLRANAGVLDDGSVLPASVLRRLLCDAEVMPVVLGGEGVLLDLGRARRVFSSSQRRALAVRDRGCVFPGCAVAPVRCQAHHLVPWARGGPTDLDQGALLCSHHHDRVHREHWVMSLAANGHVQLIPPEALDPHRVPRQHLRYHHFKPHPGPSTPRPERPAQTTPADESQPVGGEAVLGGEGVPVGGDLLGGEAALGGEGVPVGGDLLGGEAALGGEGVPVGGDLLGGEAALGGEGVPVGGDLLGGEAALGGDAAPGGEVVRGEGTPQVSLPVPRSSSGSVRASSSGKVPDG
jgi:hypothetical protein